MLVNVQPDADWASLWEWGQAADEIWGFHMKLLKFAGAAFAASMFMAGAANAASYNFSVNYSGGGVAALAAGSDDPLTTALHAGDNFVYTLSGTGGGQWTSLSGAGVFPLFAMTVAESGHRTGDLTLDLKLGGVTVFSLAENGVGTAFVHIGTNTDAVPTGLVFDQWVLTETLVSSDVADSTPNSLLPWPGQSPEVHDATAFSYAAGVPEPATWALMIGGFGLAGASLRRRKAVAA